MPIVLDGAQRRVRRKWGNRLSPMQAAPHQKAFFSIACLRLGCGEGEVLTPPHLVMNPIIAWLFWYAVIAGCVYILTNDFPIPFL